MKRLMIILIAAAFIVGLAWLAPHSLFNVTLETPTPLLPATIDAAVSNSTPESLSLSESISVAYENVSLSIPAGLGSGADGETVQVPNDIGPWGVSPDYIRFTLKGYPFPAPNAYYQPEVRIYPAAEYAQVNGWAAESLKRLQFVLANPSMSLASEMAPNGALANPPTERPENSLPNVPFMGSAAQVYAAQAKRLSFVSGNGVRMISAYAQYAAPITQRDSFYHYEGLTQDGKYFVVVTMPVVLPVYSDDTNPGENGITYPSNDMGNTAALDAYYKGMIGLLDVSSPEGFNPMLTQLDALVQSITVTAK
jgi:hypothetical protein